MQTVANDVETIHLYVVREQPKKPYTLLPLLCAFLFLAGITAVTLYSAEHPYYVHQRLTVAAEVLPLKVFTAQTPIVPTGIKTYPATTAHGTLTITNGSVIAQTLPAGLVFISSNGVSVSTDQAVFVPAGDANGYGEAYVSAHALISGRGGNIPAGAINRVEGSSLYIRNLSTFSGGRDAYSIRFVTAQDKRSALLQAHSILALQVNGLHYPCKEFYLQGLKQITVNWHCQFIQYHVPAFYHVTGVCLIGKNLLLDVWFVPRPQWLGVK